MFADLFHISSYMTEHVKLTTHSTSLYLQASSKPGTFGRPVYVDVQSAEEARRLVSDSFKLTLLGNPLYPRIVRSLTDDLLQEVALGTEYLDSARLEPYQQCTYDVIEDGEIEEERQVSRESIE